MSSPRRPPCVVSFDLNINDGIIHKTEGIAELLSTHEFKALNAVAPAVRFMGIGTHDYSFAATDQTALEFYCFVGPFLLV